MEYSVTTQTDNVILEACTIAWH
uniref:Uncharacterized protein n=1 Tax=Arundo donax TaxID=35708 RepID=A0A0A9B268_ARUDO